VQLPLALPSIMAGIIQTTMMALSMVVIASMIGAHGLGEDVLVDWIHEAGDKAIGVAINPGAYGHTSIALHDAIRAISIPVVEVHISNIHAREEFRHKSMIAPAAKGVICGFGPHSYILALHALKSITQ